MPTPPKLTPMTPEEQAAQRELYRRTLEAAQQVDPDISLCLDARREDTDWLQRVAAARRAQEQPPET